MAEETKLQTEAVEPVEAKAEVETESEPEQNDRPNPLAFASFLLGGWVATMIVFTLFAVVAMTLVGMVAG